MRTRRRPTLSPLLACCAALAGLALGCGETEPGTLTDSQPPDSQPQDAATADSGAPDGQPRDGQPRDGAADTGPEPDMALPDAAVDAAPLVPVDAETMPPMIEPGPLDDVLRLNHVQARGTHNSYHVEGPIVAHPSHRYTHLPLDEQLELQGVRQFELDLHRSDAGELEVFHIPIIDPETVCRAFGDCLRSMKSWSDANRAHMPIVVWMELKDANDGPGTGYGPIAGHYDQMEAEIRAVWPRERLFTPDDLRGDHPTLPAALAADGWPTLGALRGRIMFILLEGGHHRDGYLGDSPVGDSPVGEGRLCFVKASTTADPFAAFFKIDDGRVERARIEETVAAGFIVTSNVDPADGDPEDNADRRAQTLAAGSHFLSTDLPAPTGPDDTNWLDIPGGTPARCNPQTAPPECTPEAIEDLSR